MRFLPTFGVLQFFFFLWNQDSNKLYHYDFKHLLFGPIKITHITHIKKKNVLVFEIPRPEKGG